MREEEREERERAIDERDTERQGDKARDRGGMRLPSHLESSGETQSK